MKTQNRKPVSKKSNTKAIPKGYSSVTPFLMVTDAKEFIEFLKEAFDAEVPHATNTEDGKIMHAAVKIGSSMLMIADSMDGMPDENATLFLYVKDADAGYEKALNAGGESIQEPRDEFYGDRVSGISDKWGNKWWIATHIEDVSDEDLQTKAKETHEQMKNDPEYHKKIADWKNRNK